MKQQRQAKHHAERIKRRKAGNVQFGGVDPMPLTSGRLARAARRAQAVRKKKGPSRSTQPTPTGNRSTGKHAGRALLCKKAGVPNTGRQWRLARKAQRRAA